MCMCGRFPFYRLHFYENDLDALCFDQLLQKLHDRTEKGEHKNQIIISCQKTSVVYQLKLYSPDEAWLNKIIQTIDDDELRTDSYIYGQLKNQSSNAVVQCQCTCKRFIIFWIINH